MASASTADGFGNPDSAANARVQHYTDYCTLAGRRIDPTPRGPSC
ncbi:hypothetical protein [Streptomyces sp. NPDC059918]